MVESLFESNFRTRAGRVYRASNQNRLVRDGGSGTLFIDEMKCRRSSRQSSFGASGTAVHARRRTAEISPGSLIAATSRTYGKSVRSVSVRISCTAYPSSVAVAALRERAGYLPLVDAFIRHSSQRYGKTIFPLSPEQKQALVDYSWPGNVRELKTSSSGGNSVRAGRVVAFSFRPCEHGLIFLQSGGGRHPCGHTDTGLVNS